MKNATILPIEENALLARYTTLGIGGPARFLVRATTEDHIPEAVLFAQKRGCPLFVLGGGSNIVVSDSGFPGMVIKIEISGMTELPDGRIRAAAGEIWDNLVGHCVEKNLAGVECLSGIPGTVGGTPVQNVGAYGQEVSESILQVEVFDRQNGSTIPLSNNQCCFGYRTSLFNSTEKERYIVLHVVFGLTQNGPPLLRYGDLTRHFHGEATPSIREIREAVLKIRDLKGMVLDEGSPESRTAGSFFKNPIVDTHQIQAIEQRARTHGILALSETMPSFDGPAGKKKLAAAWMIERAGFCKGYGRGPAGISSKHTLALVNRGGARAQDVIDLMHEIRDKVRSVFDVELQPEPVFIGFDRT